MLPLQSDIYWVNCTQEPFRHRVPCHRKERNRSQSFQGIRLSHEQFFFYLEKKDKISFKSRSNRNKIGIPQKVEIFISSGI